MKKLLILALALITSVTLFSGIAAAEDLYIGTGVQYQEFDDVSSGKDNTLGGNLFVGAVVNENLAIEAGVTQTVMNDETAGSDLDIRGYSLEAVGKLPVNDMVSLLGTAGVVYSNLDLDSGVSENAWGYTVGAGAQVDMTENLFVRGLVKHDSTDFAAIDSEQSIKYLASVGFKF